MEMVKFSAKTFEGKAISVEVPKNWYLLGKQVTESQNVVFEFKGNGTNRQELKRRIDFVSCPLPKEVAYINMVTFDKFTAIALLEKTVDSEGKEGKKVIMTALKDKDNNWYYSGADVKSSVDLLGMFSRSKTWKQGHDKIYLPLAGRNVNKSSSKAQAKDFDTSNSTLTW